MAIDSSLRQGIRVRKLADYRSGTASTLYADHLTGEPSLYPLLGVVWTDEYGRKTDLEGNPFPPQKQIRIPTDYVTREPWIELVGVKAVARPKGPASNPWREAHTFLQADEIVFHMLDGDGNPVDHRYRVVHQPDKYDTADHVDGADEVPTDNAGDPSTHVDWFYDADLIEE